MKAIPAPIDEITFALSGALPSGKNQVGIDTRGGRVRRFPNKRFERWRQEAAITLLTQVRVDEKPLRGPLVARIMYNPGDRITRDLPGMMDALWHLAEYCGLVENDGQIRECYWTEGQRIRVPHVQVSLRRRRPSP